jgi:hypothetical protein
VVPGPADDQGEPFDDVGRLEHLDLLLGGEIGGVARVVGQSRRVVDLLDDVDDLPGSALLQDGTDQALVLLGQFLGARSGSGYLDLVPLHPECGAGSGGPGPDLHPGRAAHDRARLTTGQPALLLDHADGAHRRVLSVQPGHEQNPRLRVGPDAGSVRCPRRFHRGPRLRIGQVDRHDHAGQHDRVVQGQNRKRQGLAHTVLLSRTQLKS